MMQLASLNQCNTDDMISDGFHALSNKVNMYKTALNHSPDLFTEPVFTLFFWLADWNRIKLQTHKILKLFEADIGLCVTN